MESFQERELRKEMAEVGRRMYQLRLLVGLDGNISARINSEEILTTPRGVCKGYLDPDDLVVTDLSGNHLRGKKQASTELPMHLVCYKNRPDISSVLHGHPAYSTAHAVARIPLDGCLMPEFITTFGVIPVAPYGTPSTDEVPESIQKAVVHHDAVFLANHGLIVLGKGLTPTLFKMETVEHSAKIHALSQNLGSPVLLGREKVDQLMSIRSIYGLNRPVSPCRVGEDLSNTSPPDMEKWVDEITLRVLNSLKSGEKSS